MTPDGTDRQPSTLHDRAAVVPDPGVEGTVLGGRYRVGECIGAGAMGVVWSAWDRRLRRTVAVKQLTPPRDDDAADEAAVRLARARAMREGRIAARVVHPRAIAVFDVVTHGARSETPMPWLVMEYLPSRSLAAVLADRGPLPPTEVARIGAQIADALSAVHEAGIVHGDVKPGNVLLTDDGVAKLTDFGVSRASWDASSTGNGLVAGTPGYFAPEVARGGDPTPASDVFSLGATLYAAVENELVCGRLDNTLAVLHAMAEGRLRPATRAGVIGRPLSAMLRLDPDQRPGTTLLRAALEVRAAMAPDAPGQAVTAAPPTPGSATAGAAAATGAGTAPDGAAGPSGSTGTADVAGRPAATAGRPPAASSSSSGDRAGTAVGPPTAPGTGSPDGAAAPGIGGLGPLGGLADPLDTPGPATGPRPAVRRRNRRRLLAVAAASAVVLAAGVGAAVAAVGESGDRGGIEAAAPSARPSAAPTRASGGARTAVPTTTAPETVPPVAGAPLSPGSSSTTTADPGTGDPGAPVSEDDVRRTVSAYYASLPGGTAQAWTYLSDDARDASGGYDGYQRFWRGISSVSASDVQVDGTSARAVLEFTTTGGRMTRETYTFRVDRDGDGRLEILSADRGSQDSA